MIKSKSIKILLIIFSILGIISSSRVLATNSNINAYADHGAEVLDVKWSRTNEPIHDNDFIDILDNKEFKNNVIRMDEYASKRTVDEKIFSMDNLGAGPHTLTFKVTGTKNQNSSNAAANISFAKIYKTSDDNGIQINADDKSSEHTVQNKFIYSSGWNLEGRNAWTNAKGSTFTINFTGEKIELYGIKDPNQGISEITIDEENYYTSEVIDGEIHTVVNNYPSSGELGKVLVTPKTIYSGQAGNKILFKYDALTALLNPLEEKNVWDGASSNRYYSGYINDNDIANGYGVKEFATWKHYGNGDSWRLIRGDFTLDLSSSEMKNKRVYLGVLGKNGPELIMPLNDFMIVLIDGKPTDINFTTQQITDSNKDNIKFEFSDNQIYTPTFKRAYHKFGGDMICNDESHKSISKHTDTWHAHLNEHAESSPEGYTLGDITAFLDDGKNHKIELLCADNTAGGGGTKLDIFLVEDPSIEVNKSGFLLDENNKKNYIKEDGTSHVYPGETVYYNFTIKNTGNNELTKVEFNDELIDIKIDSTGIYRGDGTKLSNDRLSVVKVSADGNKVTSSGDDALNFLNSLKPGESLIVEDLCNIKYDVKLEDLNRENKVIINTVVGSAKYLNNQLTDEADASFKVYVAEYGDVVVDINKYVYEVKRDGNIIYTYNDEDSNSDKVVPGLYPGDEVSFIIKVKNRTVNGNRVDNTSLPVTNLSIKDLLSSPYETPGWTFTCKEKENFDYNNFDLKANESISILATGWIVPEPFNKNEDNSINTWDYNVVNTVNLYKKYSDGEKELGNSSAEVKILPAKLYLKKVVVDENENDISNDTNKTFSINIKGDDGSSFVIEAIPNEIYTINNLKYGVTYKINEVIPANYALESILVQGNKNNIISGEGSITLNSRNMESTIIVKNKLVNNKYFYDQDQKTNIFTYPLKDNR